MAGASEPVDVSTKQQRITGTRSTKSRDELDVSGPPHIDLDWFAPGVPADPQGLGPSVWSGQTGEDYVADLEGNLRSLLERAKSGRYQAPRCDESTSLLGGLGYRDPSAGDTDVPKTKYFNASGGHGARSRL